MSDYNRVFTFATKDALPTGNPAKTIKGSEVDQEFDALEIAVATKIDDPAPGPSVGDVLQWTGSAWAAVGDALVPTGVVLPYGGTSAPSGWLICDGSVISRTTFADLFAVYGTTYNTGGEAGTDFRLPDCTGRVVAGKEASATRLTSGGSGVDGSTLGSAGGAQTHALTEAQLASHSHTTRAQQIGGNYGGTRVTAGGGFGEHARSDALNGDVTDTAGSGQAHQNTQPTIVLNYIVKT